MTKETRPYLSPFAAYVDACLEKLQEEMKAEKSPPQIKKQTTSKDS